MCNIGRNIPPAQEVSCGFFQMYNQYVETKYITANSNQSRPLSENTGCSFLG